MIAKGIVIHAVQIETIRLELAQSKDNQDMLVQQMTGQQQDAVKEITSLQRSYEVWQYKIRSLAHVGHTD